MTFDFNSWRVLLSKVISDIMEWLPSLAGAIALLLAGWIVAFIIRMILHGLLKRIGVDKIAEKWGAVKALHAWGIARTPSRLIAMFAYWLIFLLFLLAAIESLGLNFVSEIFKTFISFLPRVLGAMLILLLGGFFANLIGLTTGSMAEKSGIPAGLLTGRLVKYAIMIFVLIIAIQQLGVDTTLLSGVIVIMLAAIALAIAIAFGLGTKEMANNIMAGFHARGSFIPGTRIQVRDYTGKLIRVGTYKFIIETKAGKISLPNHVLTEEEIILLPDEPKPE